MSINSTYIRLFGAPGYMQHIHTYIVGANFAPGYIQGPSEAFVDRLKGLVASNAQVLADAEQRVPLHFLSCSCAEIS